MVGYINKSDIKGNTWTILGTSFETTASTDIELASYVVGNFDKTVSSYDLDVMMANAPQIQVNDPQTGAPTSYFYCKDGYVPGGSDTEGWCDIGGNYISSITISAGTGFWFINPAGPCAVTFAGQVIGDNDTSLVVYPIWSLIANPYPTDLNLNGATWGNMDTTVSSYDLDVMVATAPQVQVNDASGVPTSYFYCKDGYVPGGSDTEGWCDIGGNYVAEPTVNAGCGFWFKPTGAQVTVGFAK